MSNLLQIIKQAAVEAVDASKPVSLQIGTIENTSPLRVQVDQRILLGRKQLIIMRETTLSTGDKVVLLQAQGGQQWLILGVIE